jgi:hypothetical protein
LFPKLAEKDELWRDWSLKRQINLLLQWQMYNPTKKTQHLEDIGYP